MTEETWNITLGESTFEVPRLPFKVSRVVYPICQRLTNAGLVDRIIDMTNFELTDYEMDDLAKVVFLACQAAGTGLTAEAFDELQTTPSQLFEGFFAVRKATGGWRSAVATEGQEPEGEAESGEKSPT